MAKFKEYGFNNTETGYCLITREIINENEIHNNNDTEICLYIPKLMPLIEMEDKPYIKEINGLDSSKIINSKEKFKIDLPESVRICNFIRADYYKTDNIQPSIVDKSERCTVKFLNGDIKLPRYTKEKNQEEKRKRDIFHVKIPHVDREDPTKKDYEMMIDSINEVFKLLINDDINISINEEDKSIDINNKDSKVSMNSEGVSVQYKDSSLDIDDEGININSNKCNLPDTYVNGKKLEDLITEIVGNILGGE